MNPILLQPERAWRTYIGGRNISRLHGLMEAESGHFPEEWILSTVTARNSGREQFPLEGLSKTADGQLLRDLIAKAPETMLGSAHYDKVGQSLGMLLKIIDTDERLTIQVHPSKEIAKKLFNSPFGKTECWHILEKPVPDSSEMCVYLGFRPGITEIHWRSLFDRQDIAGMLDCLHRFVVHPGDTILIEGGVPHAIGQGCYLMEIQEPTDYSIRTERTTPMGLQISDEICHQGLGFDRMFECFDYTGYDRETVKERWFVESRETKHANGTVCTSLIDSHNYSGFSLKRYDIANQLRFENMGRFYGLYVLTGEGALIDETGETSIRPGSQFFVPAKSEAFTLVAKEKLEVYGCFGPDFLA